MSTVWNDVSVTVRDLTEDESVAVDLALEAAADWQAGELPTGDALQVGGGMSPHRARGLAFRYRRDDPRLPALQRLSELMSTGNGKTILPNGTMVETYIKNQSDWLIQQARRNGKIA